MSRVEFSAHHTSHSLGTLICPSQGLRLMQTEDALLCPGADSFAIRNRVPRFVSGSKYSDAFGAQWKKYRLTQLDSYTGTSISRDRLRCCLGEELWQTLAGKTVLECGCGAGRFTEILLGQGAITTS